MTDTEDQAYATMIDLIQGKAGLRFSPLSPGGHLAHGFTVHIEPEITVATELTRGDTTDMPTDDETTAINPFVNFTLDGKDCRWNSRNTANKLYAACEIAEDTTLFCDRTATAPGSEPFPIERGNAPVILKEGDVLTSRVVV